MSGKNVTASGLHQTGRWLYWVLLAVMVVPFDAILGEGHSFITPPVALFAGLAFALIFGILFP